MLNSAYTKKRRLSNSVVMPASRPSPQVTGNLQDLSYLYLSTKQFQGWGTASSNKPMRKSKLPIGQITSFAHPLAQAKRRGSDKHQGGAERVPRRQFRQRRLFFRLQLIIPRPLGTHTSIAYSRSHPPTLVHTPILVHTHPPFTVVTGQDIPPPDDPPPRQYDRRYFDSGPQAAACASHSMLGRPPPSLKWTVRPAYITICTLALQVLTADLAGVRGRVARGACSLWGLAT